MPEIVLVWAMTITLFNPAADRIGQYKVHPFATKADCEKKIAEHMATHAKNSAIPNRYVHGACVVYSVKISWVW